MLWVQDTHRIVINLVRALGQDVAPNGEGEGAVGGRLYSYRGGGRDNNDDDDDDDDADGDGYIHGYNDEDAI
jgi:hypothetical protein